MKGKQIQRDGRDEYFVISYTNLFQAMERFHIRQYFCGPAFVRLKWAIITTFSALYTRLNVGTMNMWYRSNLDHCLTRSMTQILDLITTGSSYHYLKHHSSWLSTSSFWAQKFWITFYEKSGTFLQYLYFLLTDKYDGMQHIYFCWCMHQWMCEKL